MKRYTKMESTIHTTHEGPLFVAYDRKSARHDWRIVASSDIRMHVERYSEMWRDNARGRPGWENYQQHIAILDIQSGIIPDSLPANWRFVDGQRI